MFSTVGHIAQIAMVKSAAGLATSRNSTRPSGSQASGETGRSIWMIGSKLLANVFDSPSRKPSGVPMSSASA